MRYLLHDVVRSSVDASPDAVALVQEDGVHVTYRELDALANRYANLIRGMKDDVRTKPFVGILGPVATSSIAAAIGILRAGCAYVPLDEQSPTERLVGIVERCDLDVVVAHPALLVRHEALVGAGPVDHVILSEEAAVGTAVPSSLDGCVVTTFADVQRAPAAAPPDLAQVSDDLAYVLHSSGSTGVPKGIMLTHRNARTFVDWMQREFQLTADDVIISRAPFKFDLSVFDIFNALGAGARLVLFDWMRGRDPAERHEAYTRLIEREGVTMLYTTPSTFLALMNRGDLAARSSSLRTLMYAGEPFPTPQLRRLRAAVPTARIANIYGPTETNIITCHWVDELPSDDAPVPLGHEVDDTEILVVDPDEVRICEPGELGELWCRGGTVTVGYLGDEERTAQHLVRSPFHVAPVQFWRTGDYGFRDDDGALHYRGRRDHMVKVRGYRVELGEIESALAALDGVDEVVAVATDDRHNGTGKVLSCFFSPLSGATVTAEGARAHLAAQVPEYMVPRYVYAREVLPRTSSGKVDRMVLAAEADALLPLGPVA